MKAIVQERYGSADVLKLKEIDRPTIGDDDLLVKVEAAGLDPGVWHLMTGLPYLLRLALGLRAPRVPVRGRDVAGVVEAAGRNVHDFRPGDKVFGTSDKGTFAEYTAAPAQRFAPMPTNLSFEQAAAVPVSACTALQGLRDSGQIQPGQKVLVIGAAGGVGTYAVQLAKDVGAEVTGVCSTTKVDLVRSIGADHVIDYTQADFADGEHRYDLILDTAGNRSLAHLRRALTPHGTLVIVGGEEGGVWTQGVGRSLRALMLSPFIGPNLRGVFGTQPASDLRHLTELIETGRLTPIINRVYSLSESPNALRQMETEHASGKIVISVRRTDGPNGSPKTV